MILADSACDTHIVRRSYAAISNKDLDRSNDVSDYTVQSSL